MADLVEPLVIEGGLLSPDLVERIEEQEGQRTLRDLREPIRGLIDKGKGDRRARRVLEELPDRFSIVDYASHLWRLAREEYRRFRDLGREDTSATRERWVIPLLRLLDYHPHFLRRGINLDGKVYPISHRCDPHPDSPPLHIVAWEQEKLREQSTSGRGQKSPHSLVQEYLNNSEDVWGIVTNGRQFRILRTSGYLTRPSYIQFDLEEIFEHELFDGFVLFVRLAHRSRLPLPGQEPGECLLEKYFVKSREEGGRARDRLRDSVKNALEVLGRALIRHPANQELRDRFRDGTYSEADFYRELLYVIYRIVFLFCADERQLLTTYDPASNGQFTRLARFYSENLSASRLRRLAEAVELEAQEHYDDLWLGLQTLFRILGDAELARRFCLSPLNGELFSCNLLIDRCRVSNSDLLEAVRHLSQRVPEDERVPRRINYARMDVEELGSVYESLLDYQPAVDLQKPEPFWLEPGTERKSTGSYYTPDELVRELVRTALEPVLEERLEQAKRSAGEGDREAARRAILSIRVIDPACGSGHFLLAAARRLGQELARVETGQQEPDAEQVRRAIREVIRHCIYGVDKNPLAVDLCRVALWIEGHSRGMPLTFLDHHIKCGDSLVGVVDLSVLEDGIPDEAFAPVGEDHRASARSAKRQNADERAGQTLLAFDAGEEMERVVTSLRPVLDTPDDTPEQVRQKAEALREWEQATERDRVACDLWTAAFFQPFRRGPGAVITTGALHRYLNTGEVEQEILEAAKSLSRQYRFFHWPLEFPEVFREGGFDVVISNPPFMGGLKISGALGPKYRHWLQRAFRPFGGTADLCAAFYRRAFSVLRPGGRMGMLATNTIGQGDTRESGLAVIVREGGVITFARRFVKWPGEANVEVNLVTITKAISKGGGRDRVAERAGRGGGVGAPPTPVLDGQRVPFISSRLDSQPEAEPKRLPQNEEKAFIGDYVRGIGFVLDPDEAQALLEKDPRNRDCLFPYLNGQDLNTHPEQKPSRWVICFHDWGLERAKRYPDLLRIVEERVRPLRERLRNRDDRRDRENWWLFARYRTEMRPAIAPLRRVLVRSRVSELHAVAFVPKEYVYGDATVVFAFDDDYHFALIQSNVHEAWVWQHASTLESRNRYTPTDCFQTFPFPQNPPPEAREWAQRIGQAYHEHRRQMMLDRWIGLTSTYNLFHDPECQDEDIERLRELHAEMDRAILACYGWDDIDPRHGFYPDERGRMRFTISPAARSEILARLLELNLRLATESEAATAEKPKKEPGKRSSRRTRQPASLIEPLPESKRVTSGRARDDEAGDTGDDAPADDVDPESLVPVVRRVVMGWTWDTRWTKEELIEEVLREAGLGEEAWDAADRAIQRALDRRIIVSDDDGYRAWCLSAEHFERWQYDLLLQALYHAVANGASDRDEIHRRAVQWLGLQRVGGRTSEIFDRALADLEKLSCVERSWGRFYPLREPPPIPVPEDDVMCEIRALAQKESPSGELVREDFLTALADRLGISWYSEEQELKLHHAIQTAAGRKILEQDGNRCIHLATRSITDYKERYYDWLVERLVHRVPRGGIDDDELITTVARMLGFARTGPLIQKVLKGVIKAAIRRNLLYRDEDGYLRRV